MKTQGQNLDKFRTLVISAGVLLLLGAAPGARASDDDAHEFIGASKCKSCHEKEAIGDQYGIWLNSRHAKALESLATDQAKTWAAEAGVADPTTDDKCVSCHVTAHGVSEELLGSKFKREDAVSCEACHGPGSDYRKKAVMIDPDKSREKGLWEADEKLCVTCHNDKSPAWDPQRYTRADGSKAGFDYEAAVKLIAHPVPEDYDPMADGEAD
jgi:hypothetical protein